MSNLLRSGFSRLPKHKQFSYKPRYYDPEEEERKERLGEKSIKMEKGSFFKRKSGGHLVGALSERQVVYQDRRNKGQLSRVLLLFAMLCLPLLYIFDQMNGFVAITLLVILLILFIIKVNKF